MMCFFFKHRPAYEMRISDWSSDVCSSDLFCTAALRLAGMAALLFGWRPYEFWEATPAELAVILAEMTPGRGDGPPCGDELARLMEMFPDEIGRASCRERVVQYV